VSALPAENLDPAQRGDDCADGLTVAEAADLLGVSQRHIRRQCTTGHLSARQVGQSWVIDPACRPALRIARGDDVILAAADNPLAGLSGARRRKIQGRLAIIRAYQEALTARPATITRQEFLGRWAAAWSTAHPDQSTSPRTLYRWMQRYEREGVAGLIDGRRSGGVAKPWRQVQQFVAGLYLNEHRPAATYIYTLAEHAARANGWHCPSLRTVQLYIQHKLDPALKLAGRHPKAHRDRAVPYITRDWSKVAAMECWVGDHRQHDVWLPRLSVRKDGREVWTWQRPVLTMFIDTRSWYPVAWIIDWDAPDGNRVMAAFAKGVNEHGLPGHAILDNGKDFRKWEFAGGRPKSKKLRVDTGRVTPMLELFGVQIHWAIPYNAKAKVIEPFFGHEVANGFDRTWDTYCGSDPTKRPERLKGLKAEDYAETLTLERFRTAFGRYILNEYALTAPGPAAAGGGRSAARAFTELRDGRTITRPPAEDLALLLTPSQAVRVTQNGVWVRHHERFFWSDSLADRCGGSGRDVRRKIRYHYIPDDPSQIWVFDATSGKFLTIAEPTPGQGMHPLATSEADRAELSEAMAFQRRCAKGDRAEVRRLRGKADETLNATLAAHGLAASRLGRLDRSAATAAVGRPALQMSGDISIAADAGDKARTQRKGRRQAAQTAQQFFATTGTDDVQNVAETAPRSAPNPLDLLASGTPDNETAGRD